MGFVRTRRVAGLSVVSVMSLACVVCSAPPAVPATGTPTVVSAPARTSQVPRVSVVSSPTRDAARLAPARAVLHASRPLTVAVLGDSVGNDPGEWVSMWAGELATNRYVFVHHFDWKQERYHSDVEVFAPSGVASAEPIVVWNYGWPGGTPQRALARLDVGVPVTPDLAIVSFGHNLGPSAVQPHYAALQAGMRKRFGAVPTVTLLAHMTPTPRVGQAEGRVNLLRWLRAQGAPFVDLRTVFDAMDDPWDAFWDSVHPNVLGYRRIADGVSQALAPRPPVTQGCPRPSTAAARARLGRWSATVSGRTLRRASTLRVTDTCGRPLAHAWVRLVVTPSGGRPVAVSAETDRRGIAPIMVSSPLARRAVLTGTVTDGTTTVPLPSVTLGAR